MSTNRKATAKKSMKRSRSADPPDVQRPDPPSPPPPSLVKLLKKDAAVLRYFRSLQSNLDFDVQKWKRRARNNEQKSLELQEELADHLRKQIEGRNSEIDRSSDTDLPVRKTPPPDATLGAAYQPRRIAPETRLEMESQTNPEDPSPSTVNEDVKNTEESDRAVNDFDFELELSSSNDEDEDEPVKKKPSIPSFGIFKKNTALDLSSSDDEENAVDHEIDQGSHKIPPFQVSPQLKLAIDQLKIAQQELWQLGITLIEEPEVPITLIEEPEVPQQEQDSSIVVGEEEAPPPPPLCRRTDQEVVVDLLHFIKALVRIKLTKDDMFYFYPFMTSDHLPCYDPSSSATYPNYTEYPAHPAVSGLGTIVASLSRMDVFCAALEETNNLADYHYLLEMSEMDTKRLCVGMKGRETLVSNFLQSVEGEIVHSWPFQDRSMRLITVATHLNESQEASSRIASERDHTEDPNSNDDSNQQLIPFGSKNLARMSALAERCMLAKIVTSVYLFRQDYQRVLQLFWSYILSTSPAMTAEQYPKLPPVQSFCVMEAILCCEPPVLTNKMVSDTSHTLLSWLKREGIPSKVSDILTLAWESTAGIYRVRNGTRLDDRISDVSRVELTAYGRLRKSTSSWFGDREGTDITSPLTRVEANVSIIERDLEDMSMVDTKRDIAAGTLALILNGDARVVDAIMGKVLGKLTHLGETGRSGELSGNVFACTIAKKQLEIRQMDEYRRVVNSPMLFTPNRTGERHIRSYSSDLTSWITSQRDISSREDLILTALQCCQETADAESLLRLIDWLLARAEDMDANPTSTNSFAVLDGIEVACGLPLVRVINLDRRPDRMAAFTAQALQEGLVFVKGLASLGDDLAHKSNEDDSTADSLGYGLSAIDGQGKAAEVERRLVLLVGGKQETLNRLVETHWVPSNLKPFDSDAPNNDKIIRISPSEKACALSHVACWKGVAHTLSSIGDGSEESTTNPVFRSPELLRQRFLTSGVARGLPLFPVGDNTTSSTPVCVILEDDAILVDRFADRLEALLDELPRDFHFCALGYSRPKTAPLVPFSSQLGIPTSIWYLTGYVLSSEGARYLLNQLPVRGPVDSWMGLSMIFANNWDNIFGHKMGVGVSSKPINDPSTVLSKDDLRKVLRFRAFAASVPLCSQKVGVGTSVPAATAGGRRSWRQRDTDIVYSGNSV